MSKVYNVLSVADGISTGQVALRKAGKRYKYYAASETDKYAIKVATTNFPGTFQLGDMCGVDVSRIPFDIDLLLSGSPCQGFSFIGKNLNFKDPRSQLFFQFIRIYRDTLQFNPKVKFLFENVRMTEKSEQIITTMLGVEPIRIDSALVSPQTRKRLYWTNIEGVQMPADRELWRHEVLEYDNVPERYFLTETALKRVQVSHMKHHTDLIMVVNDRGKLRQVNKSMCVDANYFKGMDNHAQRTMVLYPDSRLRMLMPIEIERLQGLPDNYTSSISNTQRLKCLGNGWQADTVAHILSYLP